jgi:hypothetical protein
MAYRILVLFAHPALQKSTLEINESRLYRAEYATFEKYCASRWGYHRSYAYRLIAFAKATKAVSTNGDMETLWKNEGSFRAKNTAKKIGKRKAATIKPDQPSKVITSLDAEFEAFRSTIEHWRNGLSGEDFCSLMNRIMTYASDFLREEEKVAA